MKQIVLFNGQLAWQPEPGDYNYPPAQQTAQPVLMAQPVQQYYAMQSYAATPPPPSYVYLPWVPTEKQLNGAKTPQQRSLLQERLDVVDAVIRSLNAAGVPWVNTTTGKDHNGVQVLPAIEAKEPDGNNDSGNNQPSPHEAV
ncbi:hypothetical protein J9M50_004092 [Salmonella enterica]|nr:hypothetical protein [Salmonella enterica]EHI9910499.1 hypothetical protein [Salmonella enterica]EHJ0909975.1 hypothetical protein [Salmonella enterica]